MKERIKWPAGNRLDLCIPLRKITVTEEGTQFGEYVPSQAAVVMVYFVGNYASYEYTPRIEDNKLYITDNGELKPGVYAIDVRIQEPERKLRSFRCGELEIVRETRQLALGDFVLDNNVTLDADAFIFGEGPSAFEVAVRDGYTGTKAEWIESLRGREGRGIADIVALPTGAFRILLTDGSAYVTPILKGEQGVSIVDFTVSSITSQEVLCTITMSDGTTRTVNLPRGEKGEQGDAGEDGRSIQSVVMNNDYTITFSYTDGTSYTTPQALRGEQGENGQDGQDGRGVSGMSLDNDNHLTVSYTDGTTYTTPQSLQGERGVGITDFEQVGESATMCFFNIYYTNGNISQIGLPKGEQGDRGEQGPQGPKGDTVVLGEVGEYKLYNVAGSATDGAMTQDATTKAIVANTGYYECGTAAGTAAKVAVGDNEALYTLQKGGSIKVKMTNANAAASGVTLKIGSAAATPLFYNGATVSASNTWEAGEVVEVYYDGTVYQASNAQGGGGKAEKIEYDNSASGLAAENVQEALDETAGGLAELGERCMEEGERVTSSVLAQQGKWDSSGQIGTEAKIRAHLLVECIGYDKLILEIPQGFFATLYYVNSSYESIEQIGSGWFSGTNSFALDRNYNIMLNIKDENESVLTTAALAGHYWGITLIEANGYKPAAAYDDLQVYTQDLSSRKMITKEEFVQGTNNTNGVPINTGNAAPYRCITYNLIDVDENTTINVANNGQYHLMLTYSSAGVYEETTGWVSTDATYTFNSSKKVRFLASWNGGLTTIITPSQVALSIILFEKFDRLTTTEEDIESINNKIKVLGGDVNLTQSDFIQGSNITDGSINIRNTKRCITLYQYDVDANTVITVNNNGQAHIMLTYDEDGVYESTTGWITDNSTFTYTFSESKKVRFLVSWDGSITNDITPSDILATFNIHHKSDVELLEEEIGGSATTKANDSFCRFNKKISVYNPYKDHPQNQYKGQMHCHTTNSDGNLSPADVVAKYVGYGYDFMTITDHNYITPNPSPNADIVWMGNSYEDTCSTAGLQHMNVWNCTEVLNYVDMYHSTNTPSQLVNHFVKNEDSVLSYNHPEYPTVYASDATLANLPDGISFVEIYNSTIQTLLGTVQSLPTTANYGDMVIYNGTRYINHSTTKNSPNWQATTAEANPDGNLDRGFRIMLDNGHKVFCDAVDDFHMGDNMENRGWQMVFANSRTRQSIWNGLLIGASYASTGVYLNDVSFVDGVFKLDIADGENAVTTFYGYNNEVLGTSNGATAMYEVTGYEKYVRAMVVIDGKKAWTQPIWIIAVGEQYEF